MKMSINSRIWSYLILRDERNRLRELFESPTKIYLGVHSEIKQIDDILTELETFFKDNEIPIYYVQQDPKKRLEEWQNELTRIQLMLSSPDLNQLELS